MGEGDAKRIEAWLWGGLMELIKHDSAESIIAAYWHFDENDLTIEEFMKSEGGGVDEDGRPVSFTGADELDAIKRNGFWGFCDPKTKVIHVWVGDAADPEQIIFFLGHEIGHATGSPALETGDDIKDEIAEEERANEYGEVARQAFKWLKEVMPL